MGKIGRRVNFGIVLVIVFVILSYGFAVTLFTYTLVNPLKVILISIAAGMFAAMPFTLKWSQLNSRKTVVVRVICIVVVVTGFIMSATLGINYFARNQENNFEYKAKILKVLSETAYRRKRVGNKYYANGEPYKNYYIVVCLPDGRNKKFPISTKSYNKYASVSHISSRRPQYVKIVITPGGLGWDVINPIKL